MQNVSAYAPLLQAVTRYAIPYITYYTLWTDEIYNF